jgi:hypothetical protein
MKRSIAFLLALRRLAAHAEEGMWTFDNPREPRSSRLTE